MQRGFLVLVMLVFLFVTHSGCEPKASKDMKIEESQVEPHHVDAKAAESETPQHIALQATQGELRVDDEVRQAMDTESDVEDFLEDNNFDCDLSVKPKTLIHQILIPELETPSKIIPKEGDWLFVDWSRKSALFKWQDGFKTDVWFEHYHSTFYKNTFYLSEMPYLVAYSVPDKNIRFKIGPFERFDYALYREHLYIAAHYDDYYQGSKNKDNVTLRKYSLDGTLIWEQASPWPQSESGKYSARFLAAYKNSLYYEASRHFVAAVDATTGKERWRKSYPFFEKTISGSPNIDKYNNQLIFLARWPWQIVALDLDSGEINWSQSVETELWPKVISDGIIFLSYSGKAGIVALDALTGDKLWDYTDKGEDSVSLFVAKDLLVFARLCTPIIKALDKRTGKLIWEMNYAKGGKIYDDSLYCYDNKLLVYDEGVKIFE